VDRPARADKVRPAVLEHTVRLTNLVVVYGEREPLCILVHSAASSGCAVVA
jgi:hypothetical protein